MAKKPTPTTMLRLDPIGIRLDARERQALEQAAREEERPLATYARKLLVAGLVERGFLTLPKVKVANV